MSYAHPNAYAHPDAHPDTLPDQCRDNETLGGFVDDENTVKTVDTLLVSFTAQKSPKNSL